MPADIVGCNSVKEGGAATTLASKVAETDSEVSDEVLGCDESDHGELDGSSDEAADAAAVLSRFTNFEVFYTRQKLCSPEDWHISLQRFRTPLPPSFLVLPPEDDANKRRIASLLEALRTWQPEPVRWCAGAFRLRADTAIGLNGQCDGALNRVLAAAQRSGFISRQETASMLPVVALNIEPHHRVLELCAAPGSKTMQILRDMHVGHWHTGAAPPSGLLVANDVKEYRLAMVVERARRVPAATLVAACSDARFYEAPTCGIDGQPIVFDRVLCDVPCSGDATVRKAPGLLAQWSPRAALAQHATQLAILQRGLELLAPAGLLAYSTCALSPVECEAVVAAALWEAGGSVETVPVEIAGLPKLCPGLTQWQVPASYATGAEEDGALYSSWDEVPGHERDAGIVRRSMFPPRAGAPDQKKDVLRVSMQLRRCVRLLPAHDDGSGFFLVLMRQRQCEGFTESRGCARFRRGDKVHVRATGKEAEVREPRARGQFSGMVRIAYEDGSNFHVLPADLKRIDQQRSTGAFASCMEPTGAAVPRCLSPLLALINDADWSLLADFYGLFVETAEAKGAGVDVFPRNLLRLLLSPGHEGIGSVGELRLASPELCAVADGVGNVRSAGHVVFVHMAQGSSAAGGALCEPPWPLEAFPWRPSLELLPMLARCCSRRIIHAPIPERLLADGFCDLDAFGPAAAAEAASWSMGAIIILPPLSVAEGVSACRRGDDGLAFLGLLQGLRVNLVVQKGWRLDFGSIATPQRYEAGAVFRCGVSATARWIPTSRRRRR